MMLTTQSALLIVTHWLEYLQVKFIYLFIGFVEVYWVDVILDPEQDDSCCNRAETFKERNATLVIITVYDTTVYIVLE
jgi:hypothetical protein